MPLTRADSSMNPNTWKRESRSSGSSKTEVVRFALASNRSTGAPMRARKETTGVSQATRMSATGCGRGRGASGVCITRDRTRVSYGKS